MEAEKPQYVAIAFDLSEKTFRHEADDTYKAGRAETPEDFIPDIANLQELLLAHFSCQGEVITAGFTPGLSVHAGSGLVMSCSALKRAYRDVLRRGATDLRLVYLKGAMPLLAERIAGRTGHFMPPSLLDSQLATLEEPAGDEDAWVCDIARSPEAIVADLVARTRA